MPQLIWSPKALQDVARLRLFLAPKNTAAASRAVKTIRQGVKLLARHPEAGQLVDGLPPEFRDWPVGFGNSNYVARYHTDGQQVVILAVRHTKEFGF